MTLACSGCGKTISRGNASGRCNDCLQGTWRRAHIVELHAGGARVTQIAAEMGMSMQAVSAMLGRARGKTDTPREDSTAFHNRAAEIGSWKLLNAYRRYTGEAAPEASCHAPRSGRPASLADTIAHLDALSRTRALDLDESLQLERAIRIYDRYSGKGAA